MGHYLVILCQLVFTILVEGSVMIVWQNSKEALGYSVLVNLMTNPPLNLLLLYLAGQGADLYATVGIRLGLEVLVILAEALAYRGMMKTDIKNAIRISFKKLHSIYQLLSQSIINSLSRRNLPVIPAII